MNEPKNSSLFERNECRSLSGNGYPYLQIFNTLLVTEIRNNRRRCSSLALLYVQFVWFGCNCFIGTGLRIEIRECDSRNFEIACVTRDGHIFDRLRTGSSCRGSLDVHFHLRIINVEIVRESDFRILYQLDVSITGNLHLHGNGIICVYIIELMLEVIVKLTTAPENDAGLPDGNGLTSIVTGALSILSLHLYKTTKPKKSSNTLLLSAGPGTRKQYPISEGIVIFPER